MLRCFIISLIPLGFFSCKKNEQLQDDIFYSSYTDNTPFTSVDHYIDTIPGEYCPIPQPNDSSTIKGIDINGDDILDFEVEVRHHYVPWWATCNQYAYQIFIRGKHNNAEILTNQLTNLVIFKEEGTQIKGGVGSWENEATLKGNTPAPQENMNFEGTKILGVRIKSEGDPNYGWIRMNQSDFEVSIIEHAINKTFGIPIKSGQKD